MANRQRPRLALIKVLSSALLGAGPTAAQQAERAPWQAQTNSVPPAAPPAPERAPAAPISPVPPNTTIVPRSAPEARPPGAGGAGQVSLVAVLTQDGQNIDQGLVWRIFRDKPGADGKLKLLSTHRDATPMLQLEAGGYIVNVAFGRANLTRRIAVSGERPTQERFVLNAGGLRLTPALANGEAGKLTEATLTHAAAKVTFRLVARTGGDAIADTQWNVANAQGEVVKESVGALPTHVFAPGTYTVSARNAGEVFQRRFTLQAGDSVQIEVVRR